jgi:hypothetical protein
MITMAVALVVASGVALAADITCPNSVGNLCIGTNNADTMTGTNQEDRMKGRGGEDTIRAGGGDDKAFGGDANDEITAGSGNDPFVVGGAGNDSLSGGDGDDSYVFGIEQRWGGDTITTGESSGEDTLNFSSLLDPLDVDLISSPGRDEVFSDAGMLNFPATVEMENVKGGGARDVVRGNDASNDFFGNGGNDSLYGRGNVDNLFGGLGADALNGGTDNDVLNGGEIDGDVYLFENGWGVDSITDAAPSSAAPTDRLFFGQLTSSVKVDLGSGKAHETDNVSSVPFESSPNRVSWTTGVIADVTGGTTGDFLYGDGSGNKFKGLGGDDTIDVADGDAGDIVDCGPGTDTVSVDVFADLSGPERFADPIPHTGCEQVEEKPINPGT